MYGDLALAAFGLTACLVTVSVAGAAQGDPASLSPLPKRNGAARKDWLLDGEPFRAGVYRTAHADEIALDNGLVRRTFRLAPNGATVGLDNLTADQAVLRGVKPEASVTLDGVRYEVGGLKGQPNYAYLPAEWLDKLEADPAAFQFVGFEVGKPRERFAWKRVRHHASDAAWPPSGAALRMDYEMPVAPVPRGSTEGRKGLLADDFRTLDPAWEVHTSKAHDRSSFQNEGKVGEIHTPANTAVYVERPLPKGTRLVEATIDVGTDRSASWGPGLAVVFKGRVVKFHIRPGGDASRQTPAFAAVIGSREFLRLGGKEPDPSKPWTLRLRLDGARLHLEAKPADGPWRVVHTLSAAGLGEPLAVRIGKLGLSGGGDDFSGEKGDLVRLRVLGFAACGALDEKALAERKAKHERTKKVRVSVHYELYDGVPVLSKWITVHNPTDRKVTVDRLTCETLAAVEEFNWVETRGGVPLPRPTSLHAETDFAFGGFQPLNANRHVVHWRGDPQFHTQVNYRKEQPCLLVVEPTHGWKGVADYARRKGIEIGGYSLLASRRVGGGNDVVSPKGQRPTFGNCPALTSKWGQDYFRKLYQFFEKTGFRLLEHDGSYPGDLDVTPRPPLQKGGEDSRWAQWRVISDFYKWCRANGVYLNVPDFYYLSGSTKSGMGYREVNWSLPRAQQVIHTRQNIYDGTWQKTPSMGWMFVPLTQYHGGGAAATIEPLDRHLDHYERMITSNLACGVQACYRGPRLYDTDRTKAMVKRWVEWFKTYRGILESDVIHGRRADGRDLDWMLHVNPRLKHKGMLVVFNPLAEPREKTLRVNLYYTGLTKAARVSHEGGPAKEHALDRDYGIELPVRVAPEAMTWFVIEQGAAGTPARPVPAATRRATSPPRR